MRKCLNPSTTCHTADCDLRQQDNVHNRACPPYHAFRAEADKGQYRLSCITRSAARLILICIASWVSICIASRLIDKQGPACAGRHVVVSAPHHIHHQCVLWERLPGRGAGGCGCLRPPVAESQAVWQALVGNMFQHMLSVAAACTGAWLM